MSIDQVTASESIASRQGQSSSTTSIVGPNQIKDMLESPVRPKMAAPQPTPSNGASISACSQLLFQIFENATDMASLKTQERAAQKDFDKKDTDLRKWNAMNGHNKFPTHDEMHKRNKDLAKKALESSKEKCNQKIAEVEDIIHRGSECLVSTIRSGNQPDQDNQQLQLQVETLLRAIQSLDKQVQEHQSHIEKQTTANEALETELRKVKTDLATACSRQAYLETDLAKLPKNFESTFQSISDRVESLSNKFKIISHKEVATNDASSIAFADYSERLQKLERVVNDQTVSLKTVGTKLPTVDSLLERITALEGQHPNKVLAELQAEVSDSKKVLQDLASRSLATRAEIGGNMAYTKKDLESLNSRLTTLPSNIELAELRKKLAFAESATSKVEKLQSELTSFKKRLELVELQPRQNRQRSAPAEPLNEHEQFASFEERLVDLKKQVRLEKPAMVSLSNEEFDDLKKRLAKMESESVALHIPRHSMPSPGFDSESFEKSILAKVDAMQAGSDETMGALIDELTSKLNGVSHSVENLTKNELFHAGALQQIEAKYNHLVNDQKEHVGNVEKDLHDRVDAVTHGIKTINARLDNIFTKDMALHILQQMDAAYPHLRAVETTLEQHKSALEQVEARFRAIDVSVAKIPASTQALRDDFDKLQKEAACIGQVAKDARDAIDFFVNQNSKDSDTLADNFADIHGQLSDLKEWKSQQELLAKASASKPLCALARPPPVSTSRDASTSNGDGFTGSWIYCFTQVLGGTAFEGWKEERSQWLGSSAYSGETQRHPQRS
jgi:chromosome segregation ATPase